MNGETFLHRDDIARRCDITSKKRNPEKYKKKSSQNLVSKVKKKIELSLGEYNNIDEGYTIL